MRRKIYMFVLALLIINITFMNSVSAKEKEAIKFYEEGDIRYFIEMIPYDTFLNVKENTWVNDKNPLAGTKVTVANSYNFSFPGRKIKDITVSAYDGTPEEYIAHSMGQSWRDYSLFSSNNVTPKLHNISGIGTSNVDFLVRIKASLNAPYLYDITALEATKPIFDIDSDVYGFRTFLPIVFRIELEPQKGTQQSKRLILQPTSDGSYSIYTYAYSNILDSSYNNEYMLHPIKNYTANITPSLEPEKFKLDLTSVEVILNYFLDDYFFSFPLHGMDIQPFILIDKNNIVVSNPAIKHDKDYRVSLQDLEMFDITVRKIGDNYILTMEQEFQLE